ncbi:MAG: DUF2281 domain-containing protein [Cyclobacteriaceae bacterium]|nr:DUF2281 domain-containing protein [Cyclobacteriaceae bacterium]
MKALSLNTKLEFLPDDLKKKVNDFVDSLISNTPKDQKKTPKFGSLKGKIQLADDFDAPLEDFKEYM